MTVFKFTTAVTIRNGRIRRSTPQGFGVATEAQMELIETIKPFVNRWVRSRIDDNPNLQDSDVSISVKHSESAKGLSLDFKVKSVVPIGH